VVEAAIAALAADREHGATDLAREALNILEAAAVRFPGDGLGAHLDGVGVLITLARPTMASVKNAVTRALADGPLVHLGQAKRACDRARAWLNDAAKATIEKTAAMIPNGATILTCSYSGTVLEACFGASTTGKQLKVIALRSKIGDIAYGERMAESLVGRGIEGEVCPDNVSIPDLGPLTMALIGADRLSPDGSLVNGVPSLLLAKRVYDVAPLFVAAETFKLDDSKQIDAGFEAVPAGLITGYVTDRGVVQPSQVWGLRGTT
jgi:translation initiation factor eIF-2B subunit delta